MSGLLQMLGLSHHASMGLAVVLLICCGHVHAQPAALPISTSEQASVSEVLPRIVYVGDKNGSLVPWVDFPWQEVSSVRKSELKQQFVVTELNMDATARGNHVTISNRLKIRLFQKGQVRVPIGMRRCHFLSQPEIASPTEGASAYARFDEDRKGYELLVSGAKDQELTVEFATQVALQRVGGRTFFRMNVPRVSAASLLVNTGESEVEAGATPGMAVQEAGGKDAAAADVFRVEGLLTDFEFWWQPNQVADVGEAFEVQGDIEVTVDRLGDVSSIATLNVTSFSEPVDGFTIQLPPNTRWSPVAADTLSVEDYSVTSIGKQKGRETLHVVFDESSVRPSPVRLHVESDEQAGATEAARRYAISGFNVLKAVSQFGHVRVFSESDWTLDFKFGDYARQSTDVTSAREKAFDYSRPDQLSMVVTKQASELVVEPVYIVNIEETVARLTAIFRCTRRGAREVDLSVDLGPWIYQSLRPDPDNATIDNPDLLSPTNGRLDIPLTIESDRFEIVLNASLPIENSLMALTEEKASDRQLEFTQLPLEFPNPIEADLILQATVVLQNEKTIVVSTGVAPEYSEVSLPESVRQELESDADALCYRMRAVGTPAVLPILAARLMRQTSVDIDSEILSIDQNRIRMRQQMRWRVSGVPMTRALISVPKKVLDFGDLEIEVDGQPTVHNRFPNFGDFADDEQITIQVPLPKQRLGVFDIVITYDWAPWQYDGQVDLWQQLDSVNIDLALPRKASSSDSQMSLRHNFRAPRVPGYEVTLDENENGNMSWPWSVISADGEATSDSRIEFIPLLLKQVPAESQPERFEELVDRAWFQTWCTLTERADRAVFRVQGGDEDLEIVVPDVEANSLNVWVNRQATDFRKLDNNLITIKVDANEPLHVVELYCARDRDSAGMIETSLPRIADAEIVGQWYWHIVVPRNECMVAWPRNLTRAHHWEWSSFVPRHSSEMTIAELEKWSGGMSSGAKVLTGSSQYLFGAMGEPESRFVVRTAPLPVYFLALAGTVLVAALVVIYTRRPMLVVVILGAVILALVFFNPSYASIAGQIVAVGVVLVLFGQLLSWLVSSKPQPTLGRLSSSSTWIQGLRISPESNQFDEPSTTMTTTGSSRYKGAQ